MHRIVGQTRERVDADLTQRVRRFLAQRHLPGLRRLDVAARDGVVTISGTVHSFYEKQLCYECCRRVAGTRGIVDCVDVQQPGFVAAVA